MILGAITRFACEALLPPHNFKNKVGKFLFLMYILG